MPSSEVMHPQVSAIFEIPYSRTPGCKVPQGESKSTAKPGPRHLLSLDDFILEVPDPAELQFRKLQLLQATPILVNCRAKSDIQYTEDSVKQVQRCFAVAELQYWKRVLQQEARLLFNYLDIHLEAPWFFGCMLSL